MTTNDPIRSGGTGAHLLRAIRRHWVLTLFLVFAAYSIPAGIYCHRQVPMAGEIDGNDASGTLRIGELCKEGRCEPALLYEGFISKDIGERIAREYAAIVAKGGGPAADAARWLCLSSRGGASFSALFLAKGLHGGGINTCVVPIETAPGVRKASHCDSACSTVWMGGMKRLVSGEGSRVGVHRSYVGRGWPCFAPNCLAAAFYAVPHVLEPLWMGEGSERLRILRASLAYGPDEVFEITPARASEWKLQSPDMRTDDWYWRSTPEASKLVAGRAAGHLP